MRRVHHQHRVELEPDARPRLHVPHPGQQQRRQHLAVRQPLLDPRADLFEQLVARGVFDEPDERLDVRLEADEFGSSFASAARTGGSVGEEREAAQRGRRLHERCGDRVRRT